MITKDSPGLFKKKKKEKENNKKTKSRKPTLWDAICSPSSAVYSIPPAQPWTDGVHPLPALSRDRGPHSCLCAGDEKRRCRKLGRPERRLRGRSRALRGAAGSSSPAEGAASCLGSAGERGRAGGYCPRREDGGGWRGAVNAAGCAVSAGGAGKGRGRGPRPGPAPPGGERGGLRARLAGEGGSGFGEVGFGNLLHRLLLAMTPGGRRRRRQGGIGSVNEWAAAAAAAPLLNGCWADRRQPRSRCLLRPPVFCLRLAPLGAPQTCSTSSSSSSSCCSSSTSSSNSSSSTTTPRRSREAGKRRYARPGISGLSRGTALLRLPPLRRSSPRESCGGAGCGPALPRRGRRQREAGAGGRGRGGVQASTGAEPGGWRPRGAPGEEGGGRRGRGAGGGVWGAMPEEGGGGAVRRERPGRAAHPAVGRAGGRLLP